MEKTKLIIVGAGGFGREVAAMIRYSGLNEQFELQGFVDDGLTTDTLVNHLPVMGKISRLIEAVEQTAVVLAIGSPAVRKSIAQKLERNPKLKFPNILHPSVSLQNPDTIKMGKGNVIGIGSIFTTDIILGDFNLVNLSCTIGHDVKIGNFCSLMPSVNVSGGHVLKDEVYVGTGATLINATTLNEGCMIGAGALVRTNVPARKTFVGVPAIEAHPVKNH